MTFYLLRQVTRQCLITSYTQVMALIFFKWSQIRNFSHHLIFYFISRKTKSILYLFLFYKLLNDLLYQLLHSSIFIFFSFIWNKSPTFSTSNHREYHDTNPRNHRLMKFVILNYLYCSLRFFDIFYLTLLLCCTEIHVVSVTTLKPSFCTIPWLADLNTI